MDAWPSFAWSFLIVKLSLFSVQNSCRIGQWLYDQMDKALGPLELKKIAYNIFFKLMVLLAIHGRFSAFRFYCLLSALFCGSNMCTQVSSPVSKLEITRLLQPLYVFKGSRAHLRCCVFCSSVSKWGTHLAQTFLRSKRFFRIVCTLPSDMPVQLAISLTDNRASCSTTIFTAAMLALVTEVLGLPGQVSSSTENSLALKA